MPSLLSLGKYIKITPLIRTLRENLPECDISLMVIANRGTDEIVKYNPCIDEVIVYDLQRYRGFLGKAKLAPARQNENQ